ncbi:hypothetical protein GCM10012275_53650 [Longimycelium tulufanense]|uniref:Uncharacterized protein n=1 Tax=Longimycelium tulufanense TaxID=907463 RepID=A0A8J3CJE2_9PSEU|nr:hypothetical protein [Longimycelium tulufanense]GGM76163.1 hypothetical protein GCM10012275_53650 [Longimycelium tulufanense]
MRVDLNAFLAMATNVRAGSVRAIVETTDETGAPTTESVHELDAEDLLHWTHRMRDERSGETLETACDGRELTRTNGTHTAVSDLPAEWSLDDPRHFYTWLAIDDTWLVEMIRPFDFLAKLLLTDQRAEGGNLILAGEPLGNEPSPYNGFAVPDGRQIVAFLEPEHAGLSQVEIYHGDRLTARFTLTRG